MRNLIDTSGIDIQGVVSQLYNFYELGVMVFPNVLSPKNLMEFDKVISRIRHLFIPAPSCVGSVRQEMDTLYLEDVSSLIDTQSSSFFNAFNREYAEFYKLFGKIAGFEGLFNSWGINRYSERSLGITTHQDFARDHNLISNFLLKGYGRFYACMDRAKTGLEYFDTPAGSLILMRAPRNITEQVYRPFHGVEEITHERYSLLIRQTS